MIDLRIATAALALYTATIFAVGVAVGSHVATRPDVEPRYTGADLAVCLATADRALEVLDSVEVWVREMRQGPEWVTVE